MSDLNSDIKNTTDQIAGEAKEILGDATNDEEMELKGKIQSSTAHVKKTMSHVVLEPVTIIAAVVASVIGLVSLKMFSKRPGSKHKKAA